MSFSPAAKTKPGRGDVPTTARAVQQQDRRRASTAPGQRAWRVWGLLVLAGFLAFGVDVAFSRIMIHGHPLEWQGRSREWAHGLLGAFEPFGQPTAVISVVLAVYLCGGNRRRDAMRIGGSFLIASAAVNSVKLCIARVRPHHFDFGGTVFDTFQGIFLGPSGGAKYQSFPSGHTTVAVAFALSLSVVFPRGRWLFAALAALVALQRIECGAHYLSDTLFAASLAFAIHVGVFGDGPLGRWFGRVLPVVPPSV